MCGVVACLPVYPGDTGGPVPDPSALLATAWPGVPTVESLVDALDTTSARVTAAAEVWAGVAAFHVLVTSPGARAALGEAAADARRLVTRADEALDDLPLVPGGRGSEELQARVRRARDACWRLQHDLLGAAMRVQPLARDAAEPVACHSYRAIDAVLDSLGRLEVRGRDSAGLHVFVAAPDEVPAPADRR